MDMERSSSTLKSMLSAAQMSLWEWDCLQDQLTFSDQSQREFGYLTEELDGPLQNWIDLLHPEDRPGVQQAIRDHIQQKMTPYFVDARMRTKHNGYLWVRLFGQVVAWENALPARAVGVLLNIDEVKNAEKILEENLRVSQTDLKRQEQLLRTVNSIATQLMAPEEKDFDSMIRRALQRLAENIIADRAYILKNHEDEDDPYAQAIYQWVREDSFRGEIAKDTIFPFKDFSGWESTLRAGKAINAHACDLPDKPRAYFDSLGVKSILLIPVHVREAFWGLLYFADSYRYRLSDEAEVSTLQSGALLTVSAILRHQATAGLVAALESAQEFARAKSVFLANMSQEMRTPLNTILGMSAIARTSPDKLEDSLETLDKAARGLLHVINDVLEISNMETNKTQLQEEPFLLADVLADIYDTNSEEAWQKGQSFTLESPDDLPDLVGDAPRLAQALNHLVSNAIKFTPEEGAVHLVIRETLRTQREIEIEIDVIDTGIGIEQKDLALDRLYEGGGLGLSIAKGLVGRMGGSIQVDSELGEGSVFTVALRFPLYTRQNAKPDQEETPDYSGKNILLVEDNEINSMIVTSLLEETNAKVETAEDGLSALVMIARDPEQYQLVFMDTQMPGMDGYETTRKIRDLPSNKTKQVPIIALTANCFDEDIRKCLDSGMDGHVPKPVEAENLLQVMKKYFDSAG